MSKISFKFPSGQLVQIFCFFVGLCNFEFDFSNMFHFLLFLISVGNSHSSAGPKLATLLEEDGKLFVDFSSIYVYDVRFKAWGPTTFWQSFKHCSWPLTASHDLHHIQCFSSDFYACIMFTVSKPLSIDRLMAVSYGWHHWPGGLEGDIAEKNSCRTITENVRSFIHIFYDTTIVRCPMWN